MELKGNLLPGYGVFEYMLIINANESLQDKIKGIRRDFEKEFKIEHKMGGRPNIGLAQWMQYEMMEKRTVDKLKLVGMGYPFQG